ncbi:hypothetical protein A3C98_05150 [Candidatus Roizmanbacteria bacterium RIFCSPHIGHO2_02_FULL_37_15]|uniref:Uncharacterized protein n=1 Tax=Candidatus Roizmanbacteria bacterium RIFCSPLOWO2_01_FULL_37_16 TaxID=1802058 RepID=A0A1F7IPV0_9BACT|nr:MAG: hypothetical protein A2859_00645 [Candidatus Roizmanbacteria bacterium RIFCSPHIGHO2_01_FULL_37_16b]OGK20876.1 MAG: hypothetical protein A3C98_05150 [Candidatus Roizmanbacteria bacterium RIFCSPHIGHO2_02_FULL_37_15]OGK32074.1 MAG: hypothetical protein A3F57_04785 [Candidatus Roizmanbacteria bacterium RIFCSPHIGHO2_12_FULL_36_11]OGK45397.1 MAG: hypothetical protein A3B40_02745 [Candidatus Roizmanbacteria bacterium RIFCSPLOWO2_01_FULL_37_16]OGK57769.1 MAG: hypothetical protein A3I50_04085 [C
MANPDLLPDTRVLEHVNAFSSFVGIYSGLLGLRQVGRSEQGIYTYTILLATESVTNQIGGRNYITYRMTFLTVTSDGRWTVPDNNEPEGRIEVPSKDAADFSRPYFEKQFQPKESNL